MATNRRITQALLSLFMLTNVTSAIAADAPSVKCPCQFDPSFVKTKFAGFTKNGTATCMADNSVAVGKKASPDGTPVITSAVMLMLMGEGLQDAPPAGTGPNGKPDFSTMIADVESKMTQWAVGFTSQVVPPPNPANGMDPSAMVAGMGMSQSMMTGRFCTTSMMGKDANANTKQLASIAEYAACLRDLKAAAAVINVPCSP